MFNHVVTFWPHTVPDDELKTCQNLLRSENHFKEHHYRTLEHEHENVRANEPREENAREKVSGATHTPLLLGHV